MEPFTVLKGTAAPLLEPNINTDIIIRIEPLRDLGRDQLGAYAFEAWRYRPDRSENPDFVLNREPYRHAEIILGGDNFGCGSSREGAVWALHGYGIRCVIAPRFGPIFFNNCFQNGMLPIVLPMPTVERLAAAVAATQGQGELTIDLENQVVISPEGEAIPFTTDALRRELLLKGHDQLEMTLGRRAEIAAFQARDRQSHPWIYHPADHV